MFAIEMLPAGYGDCLWIEYGSRTNPRKILVDGGIAGTYDALCRRINSAGPNCEFELLIITHVDSDHIDGIVKLLANLPAGVSFKEIWFNGWKHLTPSGSRRLGGPQGEMLSSMLEQQPQRWNKAFNGDAVVVLDQPRQHTLDGNLTLTLLSPTWEQLRRLRPQWQRECEKANLIPGSTQSGHDALLRSARLRPHRLGSGLDVVKLGQSRFAADKAVANGSSIALLVEHDGRALLLCADAFPTVLEQSIDALLRARNIRRLRVDACKVSHHGSQGNTSAELVKKLRCQKYLISTNGSLFDHPDDESIGRILIQSQPEVDLFFNYRTERTTIWDDPNQQQRYRYRTTYPASGQTGLKVNLSI